MQFQDLTKCIQFDVKHTCKHIRCILQHHTLFDNRSEIFESCMSSSVLQSSQEWFQTATKSIIDEFDIQTRFRDLSEISFPPRPPKSYRCLSVVGAYDDESFQDSKRARSSTCSRTTACIQPRIPRFQDSRDCKKRMESFQV